MASESVIRGAGIERENPGIITTKQGRALEFDFLAYITRGEACFETQTHRRRAVAAGTVLYVPANTWHVFDPKKGGIWCEYWLLFDRRPIADLFGTLIGQQVDVHEVGLQPNVLEPWRELNDLWLFKQPGYREYGLYLLHRVLIELYLRRHPLHRDRPNSMVARAEFHLRSELEEGNVQFDIKRLADIAGTSYDHFRRCFKAETELSPKQYWLNLLMQRACNLLINPNRTVKDVAVTLGFEDPYYFSRLFKTKLGLSPEQYRKRHYG